MTESETTKHQAAVEASTTSQGETDEHHVETPMLAVWLSLAAILLAGLYGLYLGSSAKSKAKADAPAAHSLHWSGQAPMLANQVPEQGTNLDGHLPSIASSEISA